MKFIIELVYLLEDVTFFHKEKRKTIINYHIYSFHLNTIIVFKKEEEEEEV